MPHMIARVFFARLSLAALVAVALAAAGVGCRPADAATFYWDTSSGLWTSGDHWSDNPISGGTTGTVPTNDTTSDSAVFNQTSVNGTQQVELAQNQSIGGLTFGNTGSTTLVSDGPTVRTLSLGSGGLTVRAGAGGVTIGSGAAPVNTAIDGSQTFTNEATSTLTLTGTVSRLASAGASQTLTIAGSGTTVFSGKLMSGGTAGSLSLSKSGVGTLTFNGAGSSVFGATTIQGGTVFVDFTSHATGTNLYSTSGATLSGGRLLVKGQPTGSTSQSLGNITAKPGGGSILADANGGSTSVALGNITPNAGGTLVVGQAANSTGTVTFSRIQAPGSSGAAYSQSLLFTNGTVYDWATSTTSSPGPYVISAFTGYLPLATTAGTDTSQSRITGDTTLTGSRTTNSLKIEDPAAGQSLALGANNLTLTGGALLATGANAFTITTSGGIITTGGAVIIHQYNTEGLTIAPRFGGGFTSGFTKAGPGALTLTATDNAFTAPIFVNSGTLAIGGAGRLIGTTGTYAGNVTIATEAAFEFASSAASILSGTISGAGTFRQTGSGTTTLSNASTYSGQTTISGGVLALGVNGSFGNSTSITVGDSGSAGAVLDLTAKTADFSLGTAQTLSGGGTVRVAPAQQFLVQGTFSPGNSPGLFTFDGGTTVLSGTTVMEIFGTSRATSPSHGSGFYDAVDIVNSGTLQFGGTLTFEFSSLFDNNTTFELFSPTTGSSLTGNFLGVNVGGGYYTGLSWNQAGSVWKSSDTASGQSLEFNVTNGQLVIVPEPQTLALAAIGVAAAAWAGSNRRRRWAS